MVTVIKDGPLFRWRRKMHAGDVAKTSNQSYETIGAAVNAAKAMAWVYDCGYTCYECGHEFLPFENIAVSLEGEDVCESCCSECYQEHLDNESIGREESIQPYLI